MSEVSVRTNGFEVSEGRRFYIEDIRAGDKLTMTANEVVYVGTYKEMPSEYKNILDEINKLKNRSYDDSQVIIVTKDLVHKTAGIYRPDQFSPIAIPDWWHETIN